MADSRSALRIEETFAHLGEAGAVTPLTVTETFWSDLASGSLELGPGRLVSFFQFAADWDSWERHPAGEELVFLVSGSVDLVLDGDAGHECVELRQPGDFFIIPRNVWHTARTQEPCSALFVTAGEGTEGRPA